MAQPNIHDWNNEIDRLQQCYNNMLKNPLDSSTAANDLVMENHLQFEVKSIDGSIEPRSVSVRKLCLGRHCGRDIETTRKALDAKRAEGYHVHGNPNVCRKGRYLITNENAIEVQGPQTSGEVEIVAIMDRGEVLISVGSDHVDRTIEIMWTDAIGKVYDSAKSKQMTPAVVAREAWRYEEVKNHWDQLSPKSYIIVDGREIAYQDFKAAKLMDLEYHFRALPWLREDGVVLFCGSAQTLPSVPPDVYQVYQRPSPSLRFPSVFRCELHDPVLQRVISHSYEIISIEEPGSISL
jgi:hypothetical protein